MKRAHGNRVWRGMVLAAAIGAVAVMALSGLALADGGHGGERHRHGADTGTIVSFDEGAGVLAIQLSGEGGTTVSGMVTRHTRIRCEDEHAPDVSSRARERSNGGSGGGPDDNGRGEEEPGDDHGTGANCTASDLVAGAVVHEAELDLRNGQAVWDEVELDG